MDKVLVFVGEDGNSIVEYVVEGKVVELLDLLDEDEIKRYFEVEEDGLMMMVGEEDDGYIGILEEVMEGGMYKEVSREEMVEEIRNWL